MASYDEVMTALRNADAAGAVDDARQLAQIASRLKPATPAPSSNTDVFINAANKGVAGLPDMILNAPNNVLNLLKSGIGMGRQAAAGGRAAIGEQPLPMPELTPNPDLARRGMEAIGLINPNIVPQGGFQKGVDALTQGAVGGALTGGAGLARAAVGAGMGALSSGAATATQAATDNPALAATAGLLAPKVAAATPGVIASTAPRLMQSALKPTLENQKNGNAARAIQTMLDEGINVSAGGAQKLKDQISLLNGEIAKEIANSPAIIDKSAVYGPIKQTLDRFTNQVNPNADIAKIKTAWEEFQNHPSFEPMKNQEAQLIANIAQKQESRISALQDAGRFQTMAAQQQNLARGNEVRLSPNQPVNSPEMNVGATGGRAISPSAYPPSGPGTNVRFPERYTENVQRVPEATSAYADAMKVVAQRQAELDKAVADYQKFKDAGGAGIPIQLAQALKQGTYRILDKKYGQVATADDEAQKAISRGLKEQIAAAAPEVAPLNARESALINARDIVERRHLMEGNKNIIGLGTLAHNPFATLGFMADRSALVKSLLAHGAYNIDDHGVLSEIANRGSPIVTGTTLADLLRQRQGQP